MLGAVKGDDAAEGIPLFRALARRWKPLAPVKRRLAARAGDEALALSRAWIGKPRPRYAPTAMPDAEPKAKPAWSPWLWMK